MGRKRERVRQCRQIRQLVDDNKYTKALSLIDELPLEEVGSLDDLYLYAELYEKAEQMDKKKAIFYLIYERTKSRHVLEKLVRLTLRLGELEEARELYINYEMSGEVTLNTFELRYLLAKAEGQERSRLIEILEELKKEEYTEEWGLQLAYLYELEGKREQCIQECKDLKLWFGEGKIVDKAMVLKAKCENPDWETPKEEIIPEPKEESSSPSPEQIAEILEEDTEDISEHGIHYYTLKSAINHVRYGEHVPHFVFAGGEERITLAVAKRVTKELNHVGYVSAHSIVKITAEKLNQIDLEEQLAKISGGCILITGAPELTEKSVDMLLKAMDTYGEKIVIMLAGAFDEMDCFLDIYSQLQERLTYKVRM